MNITQLFVSNNRLIKLTSVLLFASVVSLAHESWADPLAPKALPTDVTYIQNISAKREPDLKALDTVFTHARYGAMRTPGLPLPTSAAWLDRVYFNETKTGRTQLVFAKASLQITGDVELGAVYSLKGDYVTHMRQLDGSVVALYFINHRLSEVNDLLKTIENDKSSTEGLSARNWLFTHLLPAAQALEPAHGFEHPPCSNEIVSTPHGREGVNLLSLFVNCAGQFGASAARSMLHFFPNLWNGVKGTWWLAKGAYGATTSTTKSGVWQVVKSSFLFAVDNIGRLPTILGHAWTAIQMIPLEVKTKILCELGGAVTGSALMSAATFGGGFLGIFKSLQSILQKFANVPQAKVALDIVTGVVRSRGVNKVARGLRKTQTWKITTLLSLSGDVERARRIVAELQEELLKALMGTVGDGFGSRVSVIIDRLKNAQENFEKAGKAMRAFMKENAVVERIETMISSRNVAGKPGLMERQVLDPPPEDDGTFAAFNVCRPDIATHFVPTAGKMGDLTER